MLNILGKPEFFGRWLLEGGDALENLDRTKPK